MYYTTSSCYSYLIMLNCKKCAKLGNIVLRKKDSYCTECFNTNINHKFRACIGKNKILAGNEKVLICLSGGPCSSVLLDLLNNGISLNNHKKLWITPVFFHIMGMSKDTDEGLIAKTLIRQCNHYNYNVNIVHISQYLNKNSNVPESNTIPQVNNTLNSKFNDLLLSLSISSRNDFLTKVLRDLYIHFAKMSQCKFIFTGETLGKLATNLLTNLTIGRGSQVLYDVGFCDNRNEVKILRPMKDISQEELDQYIKINQLASSSNDYCNNQENSLQVIIKKFVTDLQENYQSTVSTVCKTADKIGVGIKQYKKCTICETDVGANNNKLSALEATNYSSTVSAGQQNLSSESENSVHNKSNNYSRLSHINQSLCYTCSKMFLEINDSNIPQNVKEVIVKNI